MSTDFVMEHWQPYTKHVDFRATLQVKQNEFSVLISAFIKHGNPLLINLLSFATLLKLLSAMTRMEYYFTAFENGS